MSSPFLYTVSPLPSPLSTSAFLCLIFPSSRFIFFNHFASSRAKASFRRLGLNSFGRPLFSKSNEPRLEEQDERLRTVECPRRLRSGGALICSKEPALSRSYEGAYALTDSAEGLCSNGCTRNIGTGGARNSGSLWAGGSLVCMGCSV